MKKSQRTVKVPDSDVVPISLGARKTPKFPNSVLVRNVTACGTAQKLGLAYVMIKSLSSDERVIPGWTGFNTTMCEYPLCFQDWVSSSNRRVANRVCYDSYYSKKMHSITVL